MKNNIFTFKGYFLYSLFLDVIAYIWYKNIFFRIEEVGFGVKQHFILIAVNVCVFLFNYAISGNFALNPNSALMTTFLSNGIFVIVSWYKYVKGEDSYEGYYSQKIEADARNYSKTASEQIFGRINEYLEKQGKHN